MWDSTYCIGFVVQAGYMVHYQCELSGYGYSCLCTLMNEQGIVACSCSQDVVSFAGKTMTILCRIGGMRLQLQHGVSHHHSRTALIIYYNSI